MKNTTMRKIQFLLCAIFTALVLTGCIYQLFTLGFQENSYFVLDAVRFLYVCSSAILLFPGESIGFINTDNAWLIWLLCFVAILFLLATWICFLCRKKWAEIGLLVIISADMVFLIVQHFWLEPWFGIENLATLDIVSFVTKIFGLLLFGGHIALQHPKKGFNTAAN